jgi:hypothetical protein
MRGHGRGFRLVAILLVGVLGLTLAAPAPAQAWEYWAVSALATAGLVLVVLGVYLVVANARDSQRAAIEGELIAANLDAPGLADAWAPAPGCQESETEPAACWAPAVEPVLARASEPQGP